MKGERKMEELSTLTPEQKEFFKQICLKRIDYLFNYDEVQIEDFKQRAIGLTKQLLKEKE